MNEIEPQPFVPGEIREIERIALTEIAAEIQARMIADPQNGFLHEHAAICEELLRGDSYPKFDATMKIPESDKDDIVTSLLSKYRPDLFEERSKRLSAGIKSLRIY